MPATWLEQTNTNFWHHNSAPGGKKYNYGFQKMRLATISVATGHNSAPSGEKYNYGFQKVRVRLTMASAASGANCLF